MLKSFFLLALTLLSLNAASAPLDPLMGIYEGFWKTSGGAQGRMTAQVRPIGKGKHDGFVALYKAGTLESAMKIASTEGGKFNGSHIKDSGGALTTQMDGSAEIVDGKLSGKFKSSLGEGAFEATLAHPTSPTLGAKPPARGIVLFDGKPNDHWVALPWKISPEGSLVITSGDIETKEKLTNYKLHLEFKTPFMPEAEGQGRGNSGIYLQNKYEVQVLDSFGLYPLRNNDCGGIYTVAAPQGNACYPPGQWQTFDITFVQGNGRRRPTTVTVVQNGVTILEKVSIPAAIFEKGTGGGKTTGGFLRLQDHGNPVEYRNIWVEPFFATERK